MTAAPACISKDTKIFVAGHRGLVGSAIIETLTHQGYSNLITRSHRELDLTDEAAVADFFATVKPQRVFLAAAKVGGIHANNTFRAEFIHQNLAIQLNVIHQSWKHGVKKLLFLGSSCIYPKFCPQPMKEEYLLTGPLEETNSPYAIAKIAGIEMCDAYNRQYGTNFTPVMPTNLYGQRDNFDLLNSHVLPAMLRKFHLAQLAGAGDYEGIVRDERCFGPIPEDIRQAIGYTGHGLDQGRQPYVLLWGTGSARREFLHVDDMAAACLFVIDHATDNGLVNIGVGTDSTIKELAEKIQTIVGFEGEVRWDESKPDGTPRKLLDVSRLNTMGWQAAIGLDQGLRHTYDWYCQRSADAC